MRRLTTTLFTALTTLVLGALGPASASAYDVPIVSELKFEPATAQVGSSFVAKFAGTNVTNDTYLDVRFRVPGSSSDLVVLNWQRDCREATASSPVLSLETGR
jgi:hypothetical protein